MMKCIVVDDNKMARKALVRFIEQVHFLKLVRECNGAMDAFSFIRENEVDLMFLDIEMPGMNGMELIRSLEKHPLTILITAKEEYAVEAFTLKAIDYIVKPVTLPRFTLAVDKAREYFDKCIRQNSSSREFVFVRSNTVLTKIRLDDILWIQAMGDYVNIHTTDKKHTVHFSIGAMESKLPPAGFFRVHRSYIVALNKVDSVVQDTAFVGNSSIPIGEHFKQPLLMRLNML